jgi:DNA-binding response OmpR family regulator
MPRILIADDDASIRNMLRDALVSVGYDVIEAGDGEEALRRAREDGPDLILLDFGMPKLHGLECLSRLKGSSDTRNVPVLAVTGFSRMEDRIAASAAGVDGFLPKPLIPRDLIEAVKAFVDPPGTRREFGVGDTGF